MTIILKETSGVRYLEPLPGEILIASEQDALDILGLCGESQTHRLLLHTESMAEDFFNLKTGLAGAVLQKFATYHMKVAFVIPGTRLQGRFGEMALEANRGKQFHFCDERAQAETWLVA